MRYRFALLLFFPLLMGEDSCLSERQRSAIEVQRRAQDVAAYVPANGIEMSNYNRRGKIADDPTTILWCTSAFPIPSSPLFTVPVIGKLTSGGKRPFQGDSDGTMDPNGMYGSSGDYRYGFTPAGQYADWYGIATFCTTEPMIWQRQNTEMVMATDPKLMAAHEEARRLLAANKPEEASAVIEKAIMKEGE
ncbi:MAG: hypothetical protein NUV56_04935 [Candidatus Uhrbacteria bacterium]|nr:hypothetical protein [Candidatus Uhrbacteria bacterium]